MKKTNTAKEIDEQRYFNFKYQDQNFLFLCRELEQQKDRNDNLQTNLDWFQSVFNFLNQQEWYQNHQHEVTEYIKELQK